MASNATASATHSGCACVEQLADLAQPGGEQHHEADHRKRRDDLERAPREPAGLELVRHRDAHR